MSENIGTNLYYSSKGKSSPITNHKTIQRNSQINSNNNQSAQTSFLQQRNNNNQRNGSSNINPLHNAFLYKKFLNILMKSGEKHVAEQILYTCSLLAGIKGKTSFSHILVTAIRNVKPLVQLASQKNKRRSFRKAGSSVVPVPSNRGYKMAIDSIIQGAKKRTDGSMAFRLYSEILQAHEKKGYAFKKKVETHLQCKQDRS